MDPIMEKEKFIEILSEAATQRLGEERARLLDRAIQETAQALASLTKYRVDLEEEPAFFFG